MKNTNKKEAGSRAGLQMKVGLTTSGYGDKVSCMRHVRCWENLDKATENKE